MKPIIYCYLDQINQLLKVQSDWGENSHWGLSFEKNNEDVYHLYTSMPDIIPAGKPQPTIFSDISHLPDEEVDYGLLCRKLFSTGYETNSKRAKILVFLRVENGKAKLRGFVLKPAFQADEYPNVVDEISSDSSGFQEAEIKYVPGKNELYSRAKGILEHSLLENSKVCIIGVGSFGSYIAVELAKAGVGRFDLIDFDRLELSNVARHQCGINDLGRFKTKAISDLIKYKNPYSNITTLEININDKISDFEDSALSSDIVLCMTDNNESRNRINKFCIENNKVCIFGRAITRAEGGDIFILDGKNINSTPCLTCCIGMGLFEKADDEKSHFESVRNETPAYVSDEEVNATIQVGLSSDINPICNMIVKLSLLELSRGKESGLESLYEDLTAKYYIWVNRRESKYQSWLPMAFIANRPSILRWYGARVKKNPICPSCNSEAFSEHMLSNP